MTARLFDAAAKASSHASSLTIVFLALTGFLIGGSISFGMRKKWIGTVVVALLALACAAVALSYYRSTKG